MFKQTLCGALFFLVLGLVPQASYCAWADQQPSVIANVVSRVQNSVVRIVVVHPEDKGPSDNKLASQSDDESMTSIGSGFVIDPSGLVATNRHVVENAVSIFVGTPDGNRFRASIVGMPDKADIALLRISPDAKLPAVSFGDSDKLKVGDTVIAIGSPFGFDNSVSAGIVSSVNRNIMESPFDDYIQTDAAINHGNSGGPLFNIQGQVIGMTSVLYAPGNYTGSAGVGFAIPSNDLRFVFERLEKYGDVRAGMLPIRTQQMTALMALAIGAPSPSGAMVVGLKQQADTMKGAIQPGDVIRSFNGSAVTDPRDLNRMAARADIGSVAHLDLYRAGKTVQVAVPVLLFAQTSKPSQPLAPPPRSLGLQLAPAASGQAGALVAAIDHAGSVADSGLQPGDVILRVQQQKVATPDEAMAAIESRAAEAHYAALLIEHDGKRSWVPVALPR